MSTHSTGASRGRGVTAVLGPTNTGKTHLAIERMLAHDVGVIGLPLRLLAREVYDRVVERVGESQVALITGEEKIKPPGARFYVCTVEAMPRELDADFVAVDEIQLAADGERGHVFTNRLFHARGLNETLLLGAATMRDAIRELLPAANIVSRPRLSELTYAGEKKITRLPRRSAIVSFSASEVYAIAELVRRQRGGAAVVLGALSPRTRNAQVELFQNGDVDFLVATDAIGMGLNLDLDHVALASLRKFDGQAHRNLTPSEIGQVTGRAGRHMNDGSFGVTGQVPPFDAELIERLESHAFDQVGVLQWRSRSLDFASIDALKESLREMPDHPRLTRSRMVDDVIALENVTQDEEIVEMVRGPAAVGLLWEMCQVPDYRKVSPASHAELAATLFRFVLSDEGRIPEDWFAGQVALSDRTDGDLDTLANRLSQVRTWTFVSHRAHWLNDPEHWQARTRAVEDTLSDALHERLTQRFVDRRTSVLMRRLREKEEMTAEIGDDGKILVEDHYVGRLDGFRFTPDTASQGIHGRAARHAAAQVLSTELGMRATALVTGADETIALTPHGRIVWQGSEVAYLERGETALKPRVQILVDEHLSGPDKERVSNRLNAWLAEHLDTKLKPLMALSKAEELTGLARGLAFRITENLGVLRRDTASAEIKALDQSHRGQLRKYGVRFGAFNLYFPALLKPASAELLLLLWVLHDGSEHGFDVESLPERPQQGLTSVVADTALPDPYWRAAGFHIAGTRAVRIDMLERLSDFIRARIAWRPADGADTERENSDAAPSGATGDGGFRVVPELMSLLGCSGDEFASILRALGFRLERRKITAGSGANGATAPTPQQDQGAVSHEDLSVDMAAATESGDACRSDDVAVPTDNADESAPAQNTAPDNAEAAGTDEIWRPGKRNGAQSHRRPRRPHSQDQRQGPSQAQRQDQVQADGQSPDKKHRRSKGKSQRNAKGAPRGDGGPKGQLKRPNKGRGPDQRMGDRQSRRERTDPKDSPFAVLAELRDSLSRDSQERS